MRQEDYEDFSRKHQVQPGKGGIPKRSTRIGNDEGTQHHNDTEKASAEFQATLKGVLSALGREQDTDAITISNGETRTDDLKKGGGLNYYKVPLPPRPVQVHFEIAAKRPASAWINQWASTDEERPSAKNWQLKARGDAIVYQHILPESIGIVPGGAAPACDALFVCVECATEVSYEVRVTFSAVKLQLSKEQLQQRIQASKTGSVVEQRIQELQKNTAKRQEFDEELIRKKRKKAEEMGQCQDIKLRNAMTVIKTTRSGMLDDLRIAAIDRMQRLEQVREKRAENLDSLHKRRIMWVQREQTRRREREEKERIREEEEAEARRVKFWLTSLSMVSFAVNGGQKYKAKLEAIAQRERESHAAGKIGAEFLKFWSMSRRKNMYRNVMLARTGFIAFIRQTHLCVYLWAAPIVADFMSTRVGDQHTSGSVTMQIKAFMLKIRQIQQRWRRIKTIRNARVTICFDFFREMEDVILHRRKKNKMGATESASLPSGVHDRSERNPFGGSSKITGDIQSSTSRRSSVRTRGSADLTKTLEDADGENPEEAVLTGKLPDHVVNDALYAYFVRRQRQYIDELKKWYEQKDAEQEDLDLKGFTMGSDEMKESTKNNPKPSPMAPCLVKTLPRQHDLMFQLVEDTRFRWEIQVIKDMQSQPDNKSRSLTKRKSSSDQ